MGSPARHRPRRNPSKGCSTRYLRLLEVRKSSLSAADVVEKPLRDGPTTLLLFLALLAGGGLGEDGLGVLLEEVAAARAADVVGLALVGDRDRPASLGDDADRPR